MMTPEMLRTLRRDAKARPKKQEVIRQAKSMEKNAADRATCMVYIVNNETLPAAKKAAKRDGHTFNTSVWLSAMSEVLRLMEMLK